jgi:hypothetical protein
MERAAGFAHDDTAQVKLDKLDARLDLREERLQCFLPPLLRVQFERLLIVTYRAEMLSLPNDGRYPAMNLSIHTAPDVRPLP